MRTFPVVALISTRVVPSLRSAPNLRASTLASTDNVLRSLLRWREVSQALSIWQVRYRMIKGYRVGGMNEDFATSVAVGISVGGLLAAALVRPSMTAQARRAVAVASLAVGFLVHRWLYTHPELLAQVAHQITGQAISVVSAAVAAAVIFWKVRTP